MELCSTSNFKHLTLKHQTKDPSSARLLGDHVKPRLAETGRFKQDNETRRGQKLLISWKAEFPCRIR
jgi:hypothetical protein